MTTAAHTVNPEDVMALLDGELPAARAREVSAHLDHCAECARLTDEIRATSQALAQWSLPDAPLSLDDAVSEFAAGTEAAARGARPVRVVGVGFWNLRLSSAGGGALAVVSILVVSTIAFSFYSVHSRNHQAFMEQMSKTSGLSGPIPANGTTYWQPSVAQQPQVGVAGMAATGAQAPPPSVGAVSAVDRSQPWPAESRVAGGGGAGASRNDPLSQASTAPMIARTVALTIQAKDFAATRGSLDAIVARHRGYSAQLTVNTEENAARSLEASLRIPAPELLAALSELKSLGRVETETQSGEEVTQQHADLVARLKNSREEEERLRAILSERTGKIEDVLQVEEEIANVRGEIERMEAEQAALEHRVDFASVDLKLVEEYKANLASSDSSAGTRMHNAFIAGLTHAGDTLLGFVLFFEEYGPAILIWAAILGVPAFLVWRRIRRMKA